MNQALHIFSKDTRHLRWEILVSLALLAAYLWVAPVEWRRSFGTGANESLYVEMSVVLTALSVLVPVSWWLVITRAVHEENLLGDQQWWVTKPYDWGNLLGAKLLFLALFVFAPIFVVECVLLAEVGFHPMAVLLPLALHVAVLGVVFVLPLLAIATVTSTLARSTLTVLGLLLAMLTAVLSLQYVLDRGGFSFDVPGTGWPLVILFVAVTGVAIVLQYARRRVWRARLTMIATLVLVFAAGSVTGSPLLIAMVYRPGSEPLQFALNPAGKSLAAPAGTGDVVGISVPVKVSGIAPESGIVIEGAQATLEAVDGRRSATGWQSQFAGVYRPGDDPKATPGAIADSTESLSVRTTRGFLEREVGKPVTLHLHLAVAELRAGKPMQIAMPDHEFAVPGFGICAPREFSSSGQFNTLSCYAALREPAKTLIHVQWFDQPCSADRGSQPTVQGEGWAGGLARGTGLGMNPVMQVAFSLSMGFALSDSHGSIGDRYARPRFLCPGTPITFTPYRLVRRAEYDATFANFVIPQEELQNTGQPPGIYSYGVSVGN